jgi:hypothetical protein
MLEKIYKISGEMSVRDEPLGGDRHKWEDEMVHVQ